MTVANENAGPARQRTLAERFVDFHARNPHVYAELVRLAREAKQAGRQRVGLKELFEVCRWHLRLRTAGDVEYRMNNSLTSSYARLIIANEPDLAHLFETRRRRAQ